MGTKSKIHYVLVKARFSAPVSKADAILEVRNLAALSYEQHYGSYAENARGDNVTFRLKASRLAPAPPKRV